MLLSVFTQTLLPIALIAGLWFAPARNFAGYVIQVVGTGMVLLALLLVSPWIFLPWWLPIAYGALFVIAITIGLLQHQIGFTPLWPTTRIAWAGTILLGMLGVLGGSLSWQAMQGRQLPNVPVVDLPMPFRSGIYLVANGGSREIVNGHMMTLNPEIQRFRAYRGQSYGIDLIKINTLGLRATGFQPQDPSDYAIYNEAVYAPCSGEVIGARNDRPDMPVPTMDREFMEGNHVLLRCIDFELLLAHFRPGSVSAKIGSQVTKGQLIGRVGNSGNTSEPHLHISAQLPGSTSTPLSGEPLAITINGVYLVRNDRIRASNKHK